MMSHVQYVENYVASQSSTTAEPGLITAAHKG